MLARSCRKSGERFDAKLGHPCLSLVCYPQFTLMPYPVNTDFLPAAAPIRGGVVKPTSTAHRSRH
jgi:hypothetical protein